MAGDVENVEGKLIVVDAAIAETVATQARGGMKLPVDDFLAGKGRRQQRLHVFGGIGKFPVEFLLGFDQLLARLE